MKLKVLCGIACLVLGSVSVYGQVTRNGGDLVPNGKGWGVKASKPSGQARPNGNNGISYHGGPVILGTTNVYYIWYGNWSGNSGTTILTDLATNIGGSPYFNINTTYYNGSNGHVSNAVHYSGSTTDSYSLGTALTDANIQTIVSSAISS